MMSDINGGGKPPSHTQVTVTTDPGPNPESLEIRLNIGYFKTASGIIKLVQLVRFYLLFISLMDFTLHRNYTNCFPRNDPQ